MTDFNYTPSGGTPSNPSSTTGPSWFTAPTKSAGVIWDKGPPGGVSQSWINYAGGQIPQQALVQNYYLTPKQAKAEFQNLTPAQMSTVLGGVAAAGMKPKQARTAWGHVIDMVQAEAQNGNYLSPFDVFKGFADGSIDPRALSGGGATGPAGGSGPRASSNVSHQTQTQTQVNLSTQGETNNVLDQVLSSYLGRTPGADEKANFLKLAQAQEKAHPSVSSSSSTTKSSNSGGYNSSSTSSTSSSGTSSGGFGAADVQNLAIQQAQADKGYAEYQYGTTYMNAFLSALGAPVSGAQGTV